LTRPAILFADLRPGITQAYGTVEYRFFRRAVTAVQAEVTFTFELERFARFSGFQRRLRITLLDHQRFRVDGRQEVFRCTWVRHAKQTIVQTDFYRQRVGSAHPVNHAFHLAAIRRIFAQRFSVIRTEDGGDIPFRIFLYALGFD